MVVLVFDNASSFHLIDDSGAQKKAKRVLDHSKNGSHIYKGVET